MYMVAVLVGYGEPLVNTGWAICLPFSTNGHRSYAHGGCLSWLNCRKALVSIGWIISFLFSTDGHIETSLPL